jgi:hypothetical protein
MSADKKTAAPALRWNGWFNIVAGLAIFVQDYLVKLANYKGQFPPGGAILAVAGILVLLLAARARWIIILGFIAPAFILFGGLQQKGIGTLLTDAGHFGAFASTWIQWIAMVIAVVTGIVGIVSLFTRKRVAVNS